MRIDIVQELRATLDRHDIVNHESFVDDYGDYHDTHSTPADQVDSVDSMNSYWRYVIARLDHLRGHSSKVNTALASLTASSSRREWLNNFDRYVIPILNRGNEA